MAGDHATPARAVDGQHGGPRVAAGRDQELVPEMPGRVERDPVRGDRARQAREAPGPAVRADQDDAGATSRLQSEGHTAAERAPGPGDPVVPGHGDVRLRPERGGVATRAPGERPEHAGPAQGEQAPGGSHGERAVAARAREIHYSGDMPEQDPVPWQRESPR